LVDPLDSRGSSHLSLTLDTAAERLTSWHCLLNALRELEALYNAHRPHQGIANTRPLHPLPAPITDPEQINHLDIRKRHHSAASSTSTNMRA
jgi:hypothetical protein